MQNEIIAEQNSPLGDSQILLTGCRIYLECTNATTTNLDGSTTTAFSFANIDYNIVNKLTTSQIINVYHNMYAAWRRSI